MGNRTGRMATILAAFGTLMVVVVIAAAVLALCIQHSQKMAKYRHGIWLLVNDTHVARNQNKDVWVDQDPKQEWPTVEVSIVDFDKYWFKAEKGNREMEEVKNQGTVPITPRDDGEQRRFQIYDRKTDRLVSTNVITFRIR